MNNMTPIHSDNSILLDIEPYRQRNSDCLITCYTTISKWKKRHSYMVMLQKLQLYGEDSGFSQMMEYYHGLEFSVGAYSNPLEFYPFVRGQLAAGNPVIVYKTTDKMPWSPFYRKLELLHAIIVIGTQQDKLVVIDPLFSYGSHLVTLEDDLDSTLSYAVIEFGQGHETMFNAFTILYHYLNDYCAILRKKNYNIRQYVNLLRADVVLSHEGKLYQHPAITQMQTAEDGKECLAVLLESLQEVFFCDFQESILALRNLKDGWCVLKAQATKALIMNDLGNRLPFLLLRLLSIMQEEQVVLCRILDNMTQYSHTKGELH